MIILCIKKLYCFSGSRLTLFIKITIIREIQKELCSTGVFARGGKGNGASIVACTHRIVRDGSLPLPLYLWVCCYTELSHELLDHSEEPSLGEEVCFHEFSEPCGANRSPAIVYLKENS